MSRSAALFVLVWLAGMASGHQVAWAQEPTPDPPAASLSHTIPFSGALQRPPSSTYYVFRSSTEARQAPDRSAPVAFTITSESQALKASGMVVEHDPEGRSADENQDRTWIKLKSPSGLIGFVERSELITPQQLEAKKQSNKKLNVFEAELDAVKRSGVSVIPAGVYSLGGSCERALLRISTRSLSSATKSWCGRRPISCISSMFWTLRRRSSMIC